jgi:hypothetical protein
VTGSKKKVENLLEAVRKALESGNYLDTTHAAERQGQRKITRPEMLYVLRHGHHEARKDKCEELYNEWNYAIRGRTVDRRELRIIVSFDDAGMLIITAMDVKG